MTRICIRATRFCSFCCRYFRSFKKLFILRPQRKAIRRRQNRRPAARQQQQLQPSSSCWHHYRNFRSRNLFCLLQHHIGCGVGKRTALSQGRIPPCGICVRCVSCSAFLRLGQLDNLHDVKVIASKVDDFTSHKVKNPSRILVFVLVKLPLQSRCIFAQVAISQLIRTSGGAGSRSGRHQPSLIVSVVTQCGYISPGGIKRGLIKSCKNCTARE